MLNQYRGISNVYSMSFCVLEQYCACAQYRTFSNSYAGTDKAFRCNPSVIIYYDGLGQ